MYGKVLTGYLGSNVRDVGEVLISYGGLNVRYEKESSNRLRRIEY